MNTRKFTDDEIGLIHRTMMDKASKDDVAVFVATCERTGLDPFARQIMPQSRNSRTPDGGWKTTWTNIVTIDGLRKIAVDSGDYEGQEGPWWCGEDGEWKEVWTKKTPCFASKVLAHRKNFRTGLVGIAKYESYVQKKKDGNPNQVWEQLGDHMTAKCAEALALRRAYPNEMAGLYTSDEMGRAMQEQPQPLVAHSEEQIEEDITWTEDDLANIRSMCDKLYDLLGVIGMPETEIGLRCKYYLDMKDKIPFNTVVNRIATATDAVIKKSAKEAKGVR